MRQFFISYSTLRPDMLTGNQKKKLCPKCGYRRGPYTEVCPRCETNFAQCESEFKKEEIAEEQKDKLSEASSPDISEIKLNLSYGNKRNILYNLNTRAINLFLFAVAAIIAGILVFKYIVLLASSG